MKSNNAKTNEEYDGWMSEVRNVLRSINMSLEDWQGIWPFDFSREYENGTSPSDAGMKANQYWWHSQNKARGQGCTRVPACWLPRGHRGNCQPRYERGDYVKAEFPDEVTGIGQWMWVRIDGYDHEKQLIFGRLDNEPLNKYEGRLNVGSEVAVSYARISEHRKASEFEK